ncbi:helix-turn-helix transcriptional regulator [Paenibacillus sp. HWE-109]|uniref:helix-turn-helix transcriptional regulator n=1 Tax=Paenibacillus sp. HWE-109 TaxID=1306526 RepID=UPI003FCDA118
MALRIGRCLLPRILKKQKLSQAEFSIKVNMSESTISHYVNNRRIMSLETAKIIANALGVTIDELYEWQKVE